MEKERIAVDSSIKSLVTGLLISSVTTYVAVYPVPTFIIPTSLCFEEQSLVQC